MILKSMAAWFRLELKLACKSFFSPQRWDIYIYGSQPVLCGQDVRILHKFLPKTNILFCKCDQINCPTLLTKQDCNWSRKDMLYGWKITPKKCWTYLPHSKHGRPKQGSSKQATVRLCNPIAIISSWKLFSNRKKGSSWYKAGKLGSSCQLRSIRIFSIF